MGRGYGCGDYLWFRDGFALFGVPIDPAKLGKYVEEKRPAYNRLAEIDAGEKSAVNEFLSEQMGVENPVLPSTVITDADGVVLEVTPGVPTLSEVRKWMR